MKTKDIDAWGITLPGKRFKAPDTEQVKACRRWIKSRGRKYKVIRITWNSLGLKKMVEKDLKRYVSNGAFIRAAMLEGYAVQQCGTDSPCAFFNLMLKKGL